ncbi:DUF4397 domain-containing protein [Vibrio alfacsensis]|uniref:DUF4397 domain-containing protein n=1 Tax=Vibrio alfacsensis TaxID=1074311 RepID=A0ABN5PB35_9VIBR|nr:DUF4397 domain-containing protein [Vibrio alfacsensis]AXY00485.1 DUF4397 domain-containing protein [Vibrio alfacsensis]
MNGLTKLTVTLLAALGLTACNSDSDTDTIDFTSLQAVHASSDAPLANVWINDEAALEGVDYGVGSGYVSLREGMNSVQVDVQLPGGETTTVIPKTTLELDSDLKYTAFVVGSAVAGSATPVEPLIVTRSDDAMADPNSLDVQVVHAAAGVPEVNVFVTEPGADLMTASPVATLDYKGFTDVINIPNGDYQIRLALSTDTTNTPVFDSGPVSLTANSELTVAAINKGGSVSESPVKLLVLDGTGSSTILSVGDSFGARDGVGLSELRVGHLVDGAPNVDVLLDGNTVLSDVMFKDISDYLPVAAMSYNASVIADGVADPIINADISLESGKTYSVYAVGMVSPSIAIEPLVVTDVRRAVATSAILNVTHAASNPAAASVDVYLTTTQDISESDPAIADFAYKQSVQNIYVAAGDYYVTVTAPGDKTPVIGPAMLLPLEDGIIYQAIAIDENGGFGLLVK